MTMTNKYDADDTHDDDNVNDKSDVSLQHQNIPALKKIGCFSYFSQTLVANLVNANYQLSKQINRFGHHLPHT